MILIFPLQTQAKIVEVDIKGVGIIKVYVEKFAPEKHTIESHGDYTCLEVQAATLPTLPILFKPIVLSSTHQPRFPYR